MRKLLMAAAGLMLCAAPAAFAQRDINHGEAGVFGEYYRFGAPGAGSSHTNFGGVGGRFSVNANKWLQLEAEASYDLRQFATTTTTSATGTVTVTNTGLRVLRGLVGPKVQTSGGPVRLFATVKGGAVDFRFTGGAPVPPGAAAGINALQANNVNAELYPGGGLEAYWWIFGWRTDVGDDIYYRNGAHHNLRVTFGPHIRF